VIRPPADGGAGPPLPGVTVRKKTEELAKEGKQKTT
jgi:hypothetical protein